MRRVLVEIDGSDPRAPCAFTGRLVNERLHRKLLKEVRKNGFHETEERWLLQVDSSEFEEMISPRALRRLREWGYVRVLMDPFEAGNLYGYDGNEILSRIIQKEESA